MVTEQLKITVSVTRPTIALAKVAFSDGYQLVCGGRLVSETRNGKVIPHPEMPAYTQEMFPVEYDRWIRAQADQTAEQIEDVTVYVRRKCCGDDGETKFMRTGAPRVAALLFASKPVDEVIAWLRKEAAK